MGIIAFSLIQASQPVALQGTVSDLKTSFVSLPFGARAIVLSGQGIAKGEDIPRLIDGSLLVDSPSYLALQAGEYRVVVFHGAYHLTSNASAFTVAALTAPVLVVHGTRMVIVPPESQWRSSVAELAPLDTGIALWRSTRKIQPLPQRFLIRQFEELQLQASDAFLDILPPAHDRLSGEYSFYVDALRFVPANERSDAQRVEDVLSYLRGRVEAQDTEAVTALLSDAAYDDIFQTQRAQRVLSTMLLTVPDGSLLTMPLLSHLQHDPELWLLLSLHARYRDAASTFDAVQETKEFAFNRIFSLPLTATSSQTLSPFAIERWARTTSNIFEADEEPDDLLDALLREVIPVIRMAEERGYPQRARALAAAVQTFLETSSSRTDLAEDARAHIGELDQVDIEPIELASFETLEPASLEEEPSDDPVSADAPQPKEKIENPDLIEARAYAALRDVGALFTVETSIVAKAPDVAGVHGIVFSGPKEDHTFDFLYNVETDHVRAIVVGNKEYPYELPLQAFVEWAKK